MVTMLIRHYRYVIANRKNNQKRLKELTNSPLAEQFPEEVSYMRKQGRILYYAYPYTRRYRSYRIRVHRIHSLSES